MTAEEIVERLERGEAGRGIDMAIAIYFLPSWASHPEPSELPHLTTSLDAAVALVERVVGVRHTWSITSPQYNRDSQYRASDWTAHIWCPQKRHGWHAENRHSGPAALIAALLKAEAK